MSQRSSASAGRGGVSRGAEPTADDWNDDQWPDDPPPDDDDEWADDLWPGIPPPPPPPPPGRHLHPAVLVATGLVAAAMGAAVVLTAHALGGSPATPASQPTVQAPSQSGGNSGLGGGGGPGHASTEMFIAGQVTAVSGTSITIGGPGRSITATVTSSTRFTGRVSSITGIKVGDQVSAQLTQNGDTVTAVSVSDPAQLPASGGGP